MIQEIRHHGHTSGIAIVHVQQRLQMKRTQHTQRQPRQTRHEKYIHTKDMTHNEVEVIVQQQQRHGIMYCQQER